VQRDLLAWLVVGMSIVVSALAVLSRLRLARQDQPVDLLIPAVPLFFHLFFLSALFWDGIAQLPVLVVILSLLLLLGMLPPYGRHRQASCLARAPLRLSR